MKYTSGSVKKGRRTYFFVKDETGAMEKNCTKYLKHKIMQNRSVNTVARIAKILVFYMNYLSEKGLTIYIISAMKYADQSEHFSNFLMYVKDGAHTGEYRKVSNNTANSYL